MPVTASVHVGRLNGAVIAQLNYIDKFSTRTATSEVGLLLVLVLRRESATFQRVCSSVLPQQAPAMPTVGPVETPAPDRVAEKLVAATKCAPLIGNDGRCTFLPRP